MWIDAMLAELRVGVLEPPELGHLMKSIEIRSLSYLKGFANFLSLTTQIRT